LRYDDTSMYHPISTGNHPAFSELAQGFWCIAVVLSPATRTRDQVHGRLGHGAISMFTAVYSLLHNY